MANWKSLSVFTALSAASLIGCGVIGLFAGESGLPTSQDPPHPEYFRSLSIRPVFQSGLRLTPAQAHKSYQERPDHGFDSTLYLELNVLYRAKLVADIEFTWYPPLGESAGVSVSLGSGPSGIPLKDSQAIWAAGDAIFAPGESGRVRVSLEQDFPTFLSLQAVTRKDTVASGGFLVLGDPMARSEVPMPEAEGDSLIAGWVGNWPLVGRSQTCGKEIRPLTTVWAGTAALPHRMLLIQGRAAWIESPDSTQRDTVLFFTGERFRSRSPFFSAGDGTNKSWDLPVTWSAGPELFALSHQEDGEQRCRTDYVFARGPVLDRLVGGK